MDDSGDTFKVIVPKNRRERRALEAKERREKKRKSKSQSDRLRTVPATNAALDRENGPERGGP